MTRYSVDCIVGARPNFVKIAPILRALHAHGAFSPRLIHTGQHHDPQMNDVFFKELDIPRPDISLEISGGTVTEQTARIMLALEPVWRASSPALTLVVGDVNSTAAAALVACKLGIAIAHVEAGLRSRDRSMPEETNRLIVDRLSDLLYATEPEAIDNLRAEGIDGPQVALVGNVMIDSLFAARDRAVSPAETFVRSGAEPSFQEAARSGFGLVTLHRPSNVDDPLSLAAAIERLATLSTRLPLIFPVHPRTRAAISAHGLETRFDSDRVLVTGPLGYLAIVGLMQAARLVITDSGGVQEETTALGTPCITMRDSTERPITLTDGTNILAGADPDRMLEIAMATLADGPRPARRPALWDGEAARRIVEHLARHLSRA